MGNYIALSLIVLEVEESTGWIPRQKDGDHGFSLTRITEELNTHTDAEHQPLNISCPFSAVVLGFNVCVHSHSLALPNRDDVVGDPIKGETVCGESLVETKHLYYTIYYIL